MEERIKVLQVLEATVGGTREHLVSLLSRLDRNRFDVLVAAPRIRHDATDDQSFTDEIAALGVQHHVVEMTRSVRPGTDSRALLELFRLIRREQVHVVHAHSSKAGFLGRSAALFNRVPVIYTPNGFYFLNQPRGVKKWLYLNLERSAGLFTTRLVTVSESEREATLAHRVVQSERIVTIPNGIDMESVAPAPAVRAAVRAQLGLAPTTPVAGTLSRMVPQKDPLTWLRAARLVHEQLPEARFIWAGDGELQAETEALAAELGVAGAFHFLGFRPDGQDLMNAMDVFVLASVFEGLPYALLKAMALTLPVVATDVPGIRGVVQPGETGLLVPARDPEALAEAMLLLLREPERRSAYGCAGRRLVAECYSAENMVAQVAALYTELARRRRA